MQQQPREQWDYIIHILMNNDRMMEIEGRRAGTAGDVEAYAEDTARKYEGKVHRVQMRKVMPDTPAGRPKPHVRNVPALPSPATTVAPTTTTATVVKEEEVPAIPDGFIKVEPMRFVLPLTFPIKQEH